MLISTKLGAITGGVHPRYVRLEEPIGEDAAVQVDVGTPADAGPSITVTVTNQDDAPPVVVAQPDLDINAVVV